MSQTIKEIGEQGLLKIINKFCPRNIIGDDGAILETDKNKLLIATTDVLVENVHFSKITTSSYDIGWRSAAANLSDIAAMGALPLGLTVGLSLPPNIEVNYIKEIYQGLAQCTQKYNCNIIGGDICKSINSQFSIIHYQDFSTGKKDILLGWNYSILDHQKLLCQSKGELLYFDF